MTIKGSIHINLWPKHNPFPDHMCKPWGAFYYHFSEKLLCYTEIELYRVYPWQTTADFYWTFCESCWGIPNARSTSAYKIIHSYVIYKPVLCAKIFSLMFQASYRVITGHRVAIECAFHKHDILDFYFTVTWDHLEAMWSGCH